MTPLVSVVIPSYNRASLLKKALQSLRDQTIVEWEAIVVDNHSQDDTDDVVRACNDDRITLVKIHNHGLIAASRNRGLKAARGPYVAFLDADDWWTADKLAVSLTALQRGFDVSYHDMWLVTKEAQRTFRKRAGSRAVTPPVYADLIQHGNPILNSSVVARTELLRRIGGLSEDPELIAAEDFDCWLRLAQTTDRFCYLPGIHGFYWQGGGNASSPSRAAVSLKRLHELHVAPYMGTHRIEWPVWLEYGIARAAYLTGNRAAAQPLLRNIVTRRASPALKLKSAFMLAASRLGRSR